MRIRPSRMPARSRASGLMRPCVVVAGWVIVVRVSPRFAVIDISRTRSITAQARARAAARASRRRPRMRRPHRRSPAGARTGRPAGASAGPDSGHARPAADVRSHVASSSAAVLCARMPQRQSFEALQQDPGVERRQARPGRAQHRKHLFTNQSARAEDGAAEHSSLAVEVLRRRVNHGVDAELERPLQHRRAEAVVDHGERADFASQGREGGEVDDIHQRIRRRLAIEQARARCHRRAPGHRIDGVDVAHVDAEAPSTVE